MLINFVNSKIFELMIVHAPSYESDRSEQWEGRVLTRRFPVGKGVPTIGKSAHSSHDDSSHIEAITGSAPGLKLY